MMSFRELVEAMSDLGDALKDLKATIAKDGYKPGLEKEIASDWDVNPALLARKFKEQYGKDPKDYVAPDTSGMSKKAYEAGMKHVRNWVSKNIRGGESPLEGKTFERNNVPLIAMAWTSKGLYTWRVDNQSPWIISFPNQMSASRYIDKNVLKVK